MSSDVRNIRERMVPENSQRRQSLILHHTQSDGALAPAGAPAPTITTFLLHAESVSLLPPPGAVVRALPIVHHVWHHVRRASRRTSTLQDFRLQFLLLFLVAEIRSKAGEERHVVPEPGLLAARGHTKRDRETEREAGSRHSIVTGDGDERRI